METKPSASIKRPIDFGQQPRDERRLFTLKEIAKEAGCSLRFLQLEIARGRLRANKLGGKLVRVTATAWAEYLARGATA